MATLPNPVPDVVKTIASALGAEGIALSAPVAWNLWRISVLWPGEERLHVSGWMDGNTFNQYIYVFQLPFNPPKLRILIELQATLLDRSVRLFQKIYEPNDGKEPRGSGSVITVTGSSAGASSVRRELNGSASAHRKGGGTGKSSGFPSKKPPRPNESKSTTVKRYAWVRFGHTGAWNMQGTPVDESYTSYTREWTGTTTPGFGSLRPSQLPVNPHTVRIRKTVNYPLIISSHNVAIGNASGEVRQHTAFYPGATLPSHDSEAEAKALKRLIARVTSDAEANIALTLAEGRQTIRMVEKTISRLTGSVKALKGGNIPKALDSLFSGRSTVFRRKGGPSSTKDLAQNWLELQYGWKPLINDVHGALEALGRYYSANAAVARSRSSARTRREIVTVVANHLSGSRPSPGNLKRVLTSDCRFTVDWRIHDAALALLAQTGFTNPVNLAWELLPYSFVVDWFYPLGQFLQQLSAWDGLIFLRGSKTQFTRQITTSRLSYFGVSPANANQRDSVESYYQDEWIVLDRSKLNEFPSTVLPSLRAGLSTHRALNALALLRAAFK